MKFYQSMKAYNTSLFFVILYTNPYELYKVSENKSIEKFYI